jgi:hypothetical protein
MNLQEILIRIVGSARQIGAEKVFVSRFDVASTPYLRWSSCDDQFIDRVYPVLPGEPEVEDPIIYSTDAVAPGWVVFVGGGGVNIKDLSEWVKEDHVKA